MDNYFAYFANKGNHPSKENILALESKLIFNRFNEEIATDIIEKALAEAKEKYDRPIGIRIFYRGQVFKQYLMEGIHEGWLLRKEKVCLETKHSSYYIFLDNIDTHQYDDMIDDESYGICGGSFPLIVNGEFEGVITCTGLRPQEDHDVTVESIKRVLDK